MRTPCKAPVRNKTRGRGINPGLPWLCGLLLAVSNVLGQQPLFRVAAVTPGDAAVLPAFPATVTVAFSAPLRLDSVQAGDLVVNGVSATSVMLVDSTHLAFDVGAADAGEGAYTLTLAAGCLEDTQGNALEAFTATFDVDVTPPRVVASSLLEGAVVPPGALSCTWEFSEALEAKTVTTACVMLLDAGGSQVFPDSFGYNALARQLTASFSPLTEGIYSLALLSGENRFEDLAGWTLDGEPAPGTTVPSGDGHAGGDFRVNLVVDATAQPFPALLKAAPPAGSLVYTGSVRAAIAPVSDTDAYTLTLDPGQCLAVIVAPAATFKPTARVMAPDGSVLGEVTAAGSGAPVVLQTLSVVAGGTYTVTLAGADGTAGDYTVTLALNAVVEAERHGGAANDTPGTAQSLDPVMLPLVGNSAQIAVLGALRTTGADTDWYGLALPAGGSVGLGLAQLTAGSARLEVFDMVGTLLAAGHPAANLAAAIPCLVAPAAGTMYVRVSGTNAQYNLVIVRSGVFDTETNELPAAAQDLQPEGVVLGAIEAPGAVDDYRVAATAGDQLAISTLTPADGAGVFANDLDPALELYSPAGGGVAANDDGGPDGRNAALIYTALESGDYRLRIRGAGGSRGEYALRVTGATGGAQPFRVAAVTPAAGLLLPAFPATIRLAFSASLRLDTVAAGDLFVNGVPATSVMIVDSTHVDFDVAAADAGDGVYTLTLAGGCLQDTQGNPLEPCAVTFTVDTTPEPEIEVAVGGRLLATPGLLDFGDATPDAPVDRTVTVRNGGLEPLQLVQLDPCALPPGFSLLEAFDRTTLAYGEATSFRLRLHWPTPGALGGTLSLASNDADENPFVLAFTGRVVCLDAPLIVDDGDPGFTSNGDGDWPVVLGDGYLRDYHVSMAFGAAVWNEARWRLRVTPGVYRISFTWPDVPDRWSSPFCIIYDGEAELAGTSLDQTGLPDDFSDAGVTWEDVRPWWDQAGWFVTQTNLSLVLADWGEGHTLADAVRVQRVAALPVADLEIWDGAVAVTNGGTVAFGTLPLGVVTTKTLRIRNAGAGSTFLNPPAPPPFGFEQLAGLDRLNLDPGEVTSLTLRCGGVGGGHAGALRFESADPDANPFVVYLAGTSTVVGAGHALRCDGLSADVNIGNPPALRLTDALTVEAWFRTDEALIGDYRALVTKWHTAGASASYGLYWTTAFGLGFHLNSEANVPLQAVSRAPWNDGQWHHVAGTWDGTTIRLFVDGYERETVSAPAFGRIAATPNHVRIGSDHSRSADRFFVGDVDEVRIWNVARTGDEIRDAMHRPLSGRDPGLAACYRCDGAVTATLFDATTNRCDGSLEFGAAFVPSAAPVAARIASHANLRGVWTGQIRSLESSILGVSLAGSEALAYRVFGHDDGPLARNQTDTPAGCLWRLDRAWRMEGPSWMQGELAFDCAGLRALIAAGLNLVLLRSSDGTFAGATPLPAVYDAVHDILRASTLIEDGATYTLGEWATRYWVITTAASGYGIIQAERDVVVSDGASASFTLQPGAFHHVADVRTNGVSVGPTRAYTWTNVTAHGMLEAVFAPDLAAGGTPHWWLDQYGLTAGGLSFDQAEAGNPDGDPFTSGEEYIADSDPNDPASHFRVLAVSRNVPVTVTFESSAARRYTLLGCDTLLGGAWDPVPGGGPRPGVGGPDALTDTGAVPRPFYRLKVELP